MWRIGCSLSSVFACVPACVSACTRACVRPRADVCPYIYIYIYIDMCVCKNLYLSIHMLYVLLSGPSLGLL